MSTWRFGLTWPPILTGCTVSHVILIHWVHREWRFPDIYVPRLRLLGELMVNALQRKQAFDDLQASEERLGRAAAAGGCGLWDLEAVSGNIWMTPEARQIYGLALDESATSARFATLLHPVRSRNEGC